MILKDPFLALCKDRDSLPKSNSKYGGPENWLSNNILKDKDLLGLTFDFFIDWSSNSCSNEIWIKKILSENYNYDTLIKNHTEIFAENFESNYLTCLSAFCGFYKIEPYFIIYRDKLDWSDNDQLLKVHFSKTTVGSLTFSFNKITLKELQTEIKEKSGGPVRVGKKGLVYGTSSLECFLSKTDSLYPGDADLVLIKPSGEIIGILEFKKHNLNTSISRQRLSNYYPHPDGRKYNRLALLRDFLDKKIPILNIYYPTKTEFTEGRLELLEGSNNNLSTKVASNFSLQDINNSPELLLNKIIKAVEYHNNL